MEKTLSIECEIRGLKCDAKGCDYSNPDIGFEAIPECLNKPCPKCGGNLLTEADLKVTQAMIAICDWVNSMGFPAGEFGDKPYIVRVNMDGSGIPSPEIIEL